MTTLTLEPPVPLSRWRPTPARLVRLLVGLVVFGAGDALLVASLLGNSPWTVFAQGVAVQTPLSIGAATIVTSFVLLLLWIPLGQKPGLGTVLNAVVVGLAIDATLLVLPDSAPLAVRGIEVLAGIGLVGIGSGLYLSTVLGPGPRDGLMTGLHRRTGQPVALVRTAIEITALVVGVLLGGRFGVGTVAFALLIGPAVALGLRVAGVHRPDTL
jgi:uncharacterized membrane protein YczE